MLWGSHGGGKICCGTPAPVGWKKPVRDSCGSVAVFDFLTHKMGGGGHL